MNFSHKNTLMLALLATATLSACATHTPQTHSNAPSKAPVTVVTPSTPSTPAPVMPDGHSARDSLDWRGFYTGTIPCASCSGIQIWLKLDESSKATEYHLIENYLGKKDGTFHSSGQAVWRANSSVLELKGKNENRALFIGEHFAEFLGADQNKASGRSDYTLHKMDSFTGDQWLMLVDPRQVRTEQRSGQTIVRFPAILNYSKIAQGGHRSLSASYVIDCAKKQYDMPTVQYYKQPFASGQLIAQSNDNAGNWLPTRNDSVFSQAAEQYCR